MNAFVAILFASLLSRLGYQMQRMRSTLLQRFSNIRRGEALPAPAP